MMSRRCKERGIPGSIEIIFIACKELGIYIISNVYCLLYLQISYTATSISLSDTRRFPNFFRTISSDNASIDTITAVVREYGWQQVAIVEERSELYSNVSAV